MLEDQLPAGGTRRKRAAARPHPAAHAVIRPSQAADDAAELNWAGELWITRVG